MTVYHTVEDGNGKVLEQTELPDPEPTVGEARALHRHAGAAHLVDGAEDRGEHLGRGAGLMRRTVARVLAALAVLVAVSCEGVRPAGNDPLPRRPGAFTELIGPAVARPLISDVGAFRVNCGLSHLNYSDPIVAPGKPLGSHLHQFFGNTATDWRSTAASIASTGGSTCTGGTLNRTAYWTPALIDTRGHDCTGTEAEVIAEGCRALIPGGDPAKARSCDPFAWVEFCTDSVNAMQVYYKTGYDGVAPASVQPFPAGLRMIAGDAQGHHGAAARRRLVDVQAEPRRPGPALGDDRWDRTAVRVSCSPPPSSSPSAGTAATSTHRTTSPHGLRRRLARQGLPELAPGAAPTGHDVGPLAAPGRRQPRQPPPRIGHARRTRRHREPLRLVRRMGPRHVRPRRRRVPQPVP
jgi:hypothetical protein